MTQITNSNDAMSILFPEFLNLDHEEAWVVFLNADNRVLCKEMITKGTLTSTPIDARTILRRALLNNAAGIILAHNHPSGNAIPSKSDIDQTKVLRDACNLMSVNLLDHIIVAEDTYFSFASSEISTFKEL